MLKMFSVTTISSIVITYFRLKCIILLTNPTGWGTIGTVNRRTAVEYMTPQEIERLLKVTFEANPDHHLAIMLAVATGARTSQILGDSYKRRTVIKDGNKRVYQPTDEERRVRGLTGTDVDQAGGRVRVHAAKGGKSRFYPLPTHENPALNLRERLTERAKQAGNGRLLGGLTRQYLDKAIKKYGEQAGIHPSLRHLHAIRHGVAMVIFDSTQRPGAITNFLGHSDDSSAFPYLRENDGKGADQAIANMWASFAA
jgi:integrase